MRSRKTLIQTDVSISSMTSFAQVFVVEIFVKLNFPCKVEEVSLAARSHQLFQSQVNQLLLDGEISKFKCFIKERFVEVENDLHRAIVGNYELQE